MQKLERPFGKVQEVKLLQGLEINSSNIRVKFDKKEVILKKIKIKKLELNNLLKIYQIIQIKDISCPKLLLDPIKTEDDEWILCLEYYKGHYFGRRLEELEIIRSPIKSLIKGFSQFPDNNLVNMEIYSENARQDIKEFYRLIKNSKIFIDPKLKK